jgi:hypothetical protein
MTATEPPPAQQAAHSIEPRRWRPPPAGLSPRAGAGQRPPPNPSFLHAIIPALAPNVPKAAKSVRAGSGSLRKEWQASARGMLHPRAPPASASAISRPGGKVARMARQEGQVEQEDQRNGDASDRCATLDTWWGHRRAAPSPGQRGVSSGRAPASERPPARARRPGPYGAAGLGRPAQNIGLPAGQQLGAPREQARSDQGPERLGRM